MEISDPQYLYLIVTQKAWRESLRGEKVILSSFHNEFIHLAKEDQLPHVLQKFWKDVDCVVLKVDTNKLIGRLVYEVNPGGTNKYYHLYEGFVPVKAVVEAVNG